MEKKKKEEAKTAENGIMNSNKQIENSCHSYGSGGGSDWQDKRSKKLSIESNLLVTEKPSVAGSLFSENKWRWKNNRQKKT
jgi:hypothetical protein